MKGYNCDFFVFDIETGGLDPDNSAVCEISFSIIDWYLKDIEDKTFLIKPYNNTKLYRPQAMEVNGLSVEYLESNGIFAGSVISEMVRMFVESKKRTGCKPMLVGHNSINFDNLFLGEFLKISNLELCSYVDSLLDTMWIARIKYPDLENYKLSTCLAKENIQLLDAHTSLSDTISTKKLFVQYMECLRGGIDKKKNKYRVDFQF